MKGTVRINLHAEWQGGSSADVAEFTRAEWDAMSPAEQRKAMEDMAAEHAASSGIGFGASCEDPADEPN